MLFTYPDSSEGNLMLSPSVLSPYLHASTQVHTQTQRRMNAYESVAQTCRWYKSLLLLLSLTPIQVSHKVWTDKYVDPHVYTAICAVYASGCELHTFLAWWMLQYGCQPGHPENKLEHHRVPTSRKLWLSHGKKDCEEHSEVQQGPVQPIRVNTFLVNERCRSWL